MHPNRFFRFGQGIGNKLYLRFLAIALIPLSVVSFISYHTARDSLVENAQHFLADTTELKAKYIEAYIRDRLNQLQLQSRNHANIEFLQLLQAEFKDSGQPLNQFIQGTRWKELSSRQGQDLHHLQQSQDYYDVFLIDGDGNILFTAAAEDDLGTNLFQGKYAATKFGKAARVAFKEGRPIYSDLEHYAPSNLEVASFLIHPIFTEDGQKVGLVAVQLSLGAIDEILNYAMEPGHVEDSFLLGSDMLMRSNSRLEADSTVLKRKVDTEASRQWLGAEQTRHTTLDHDHSTLPDDVSGHHEHDYSDSYLNHRGAEVLGISRNLPFLESLDVHWTLVAEIETAGAFASVHRLTLLMVGLLVITIAVVPFLASTIINRIVQPLTQLTAWARRIADGELVYQEVETRDDELGALNDSMRQVVTSYRHITQQAKKIAEGDYSANIVPRSDKDRLGSAMSSMTKALREAAAANERQHWLITHLAEAGQLLQEQETLQQLLDASLSRLAGATGARYGALYLARADDGEEAYHLASGYALGQEEIPSRFAPGQGLVGQCALEGKPILLSEAPADYPSIQSGLGKAKPLNILLLPLTHNERTLAVLELASFKPFTEIQQELLHQLNDRLGLAINNMQASQRTRELLEETQAMSEELETQQESLRATNEELTAKSESLEEQSERLAKAKGEIETKVQELEQANRYKSEFLANMSHELRTPLNSLLILARILADNEEGNLNNDQVESSRVIHESGSHLLQLINNILDISKVEAGHMEIHPDILDPTTLAQSLSRRFAHMAEEKDLGFRISLGDNLPAALVTDPVKVEQILTNIIGNAIKFTEQGKIDVHIGRAERRGAEETLPGPIAISVTDSGIGIPADKLESVFDAFKQVDGSTNRQYGGTGLGLSISLAYARLLGGDLKVESSTDRGSVFTLYLPESLPETTAQVPPPGLERQPSSPVATPRPASGPETSPPFPDDRAALSGGEPAILVVEDDPKFARILYEECHRNEHKCLVATDGETGLALARRYTVSGILLDVMLPVMDGYEFLEHLHTDLATHHIPVHFISALDETDHHHGKGIVGYLTKPVGREQISHALDSLGQYESDGPRRLLLVEDDADLGQALTNLLANEDVQTQVAASGEQALEILRQEPVDCVILDLGLPGMDGFEVLEQASVEKGLRLPPVIIYSGMELSREQHLRLREYSSSIIRKSERSPERLKDEAALFLHSVRQKPAASLDTAIHHPEADLSGKQVMVVDDDMRNTYALAKALRTKGLEVHMATDGAHALSILDSNPEMDLVLMDIMMPEMDGYEAMRRIRNQERFRELPIIAVTAKAMQGDKEKCLEAGATDYSTKPLDMDSLLSKMRILI